MPKPGEEGRLEEDSHPLLTLTHTLSLILIPSHPNTSARAWHHPVDDLEPLPEEEMTIPPPLAGAIKEAAPVLRRIVNFIGLDAVPTAVFLRSYSVCKLLMGTNLGAITEEQAALLAGKTGRAAPNKVKRDMQKMLHVGFGAAGDKLQSARDQCKQSRLNNLL